MLKSAKYKNKKKGFTLIEIVVALGILVMIGGLTLTSLSAIPKTRMKQTAQTIKTEFESTRNLAKTHGGNAMLSISDTDEGILITRTSTETKGDGTLKTVIDKESVIEDKELILMFKRTGDDNEYVLGKDDSDGDGIVDSKLSIEFSQTNGSIIGPDMLDYIILSNGSKDYKLVIKQVSGMIYYDYEINDGDILENTVNTNAIVVDLPMFVDENGILTDGGLTDSHDPIVIKYSGKSEQPEFSYDARYIKISGVYRAIEEGTYTVTFILKNPHTTTWNDENATTEPKTLVWYIEE